MALLLRFNGRNTTLGYKMKTDTHRIYILLTVSEDI